MRLIRPIETDLVTLSPAEPGSGIHIHGIQAAARNVMKYDMRVDLYQGKRIAFLTEHILSVTKLLGLEDVDIRGKESQWDFARPVHRFAYSLGMKTDSIFGPPSGSHCFQVAEHTDCMESWNSRRYCSVIEPVIYDHPAYGRIEILPAKPGEGMQFQIADNVAAVEATVFVTCRENDPALLHKILHSRTPAVRGFGLEEPLWHAIGDFTADLCGVGDLTDAVVRAKVVNAYHALTVGAVKRMEERGVMICE